MPSTSRVLTVLNDRVINALPLPPKPKQWLYFDRGTKSGLGGVPTKTLAIHVTYNGTKTWRVIWYEPKTGRMRSAKLGRWSVMGIHEARIKGKEFNTKRGEPTEADRDQFATVAESWFKEIVEGEQHLTGKTTRRLLDTLVKPVWEKRKMSEIKRSDVRDLLRRIEAERTKTVAHAVRSTVLSPLFRWYADDHDDFKLPVGQHRRKRHGNGRKARSRILADHEIRALWKCTEDGHPYSGLLRLALLSAQRIDRLRMLKHSDVKAGVWYQKLPSERSKGVPADLRLGPLALKVISAQKKLSGCDLVFTVSGEKPLASINRYKQRIDARMRVELLGSVERWTTHDLRRTWRSLASRARVERAYAESVLGHVLPGVEGVYDRHDPSIERGEALLKVEALIKSILDPPAENVIPLRGAHQEAAS